MYDVIIIGARCAGATTAMLLARQGIRTLLVDRSDVATDVISTHFLHPRGNSYLKRFGLLDRLLKSTPPITNALWRIEDIPFQSVVDAKWVKNRLMRAHGWSDQEAGACAVNIFTGPRRKVLDKLLADAAAEAGAEVRFGISVDELLTDASGRVTGIRGRTANGTPVTEHARLVVGADGRHSFVARTVKPERYNERLRCTYAYYTYYSGVRLEEAGWFGRGRMASVAYPTNDGLILVAAMGPREYFTSFRKDVQANHFATVEFVWPELAEQIRTKGRREERVYGTADQPAFFHKPYGPGWALVGDAGYQKDQVTAIGITHAFRDSEFLAQAVKEGLSGARPLEEALADYERRRNEDSFAYYDFVCEHAQFKPIKLEDLQFLTAVRGNQVQMNAYEATAGDAIPVEEYFGEENIKRIFAEARTDLPEPESLKNHDALARKYATDPWVKPGVAYGGAS